MRTKLKFFFFILVMGIKTIITAQNLKIGQNLYNNQSISKGQKESIDKALAKMQNCMKLFYFKEKKVYENTCAPIFNGDGKSASEFIQIKLSENSLFVILIENSTLPPPEILLNQSSYKGSLVSCCSYFVKYGEIDQSSIKYCWLNKKRIYLPNNEFTEELWVSNNMFFTITGKQFFQTLTIKDVKKITLTKMGATFCD